MTREFLVVVCDFGFKGISGLPYETDPVLVICSNAVLAAPISRKPFKPIAGWNGEFPKILNKIDLVEFSASYGPNVYRACRTRNSRVNSVEHVFCPLIVERRYHELHYNTWRYSLIV